MLFPTFTFAAFFAVVLPLSWAVRSRPSVWKVVVLSASWVFYGYWDWRFLALLGAMTVVNEVAAVAVHRSSGGRRAQVTAMAVARRTLPTSRRAARKALGG